MNKILLFDWLFLNLKHYMYLCLTRIELKKLFIMQICCEFKLRNLNS